MHVVWSDRFLETYSGDPASAPGRLEPAVGALQGRVEWTSAAPVEETALLHCHTGDHLQWVQKQGVYDIAALAAGGAVEAARLGADEPAFALIRPPGHHASRASAWGFCYLNNLAVALASLRLAGNVQSALVVDFDLHYGDGTADILGGEEWVKLVNPGAPDRQAYLGQVHNALAGFEGDCVAFSAGFDNHLQDWGGLLHTEDYARIGEAGGARARELQARCFGVLEGGYNHASLAESLAAFLGGLQRGWDAGSPPS